MPFNESSNKLDTLCPHPIMLAPMVGLSHYAVRAALAEFLPEGARTLWPTEMLNSRRLIDQKENQNPETTFLDKANGLCPQILGNEEESIRRSIEKLVGWGASAIDINMGCPVEKALRHNYGVALMGDAKYAAEVTAMAVRSSSLPVSVKLRAGLGVSKNDDLAKMADSSEFLFEFVEGLFEAGASWITLHPRTAEQKRRGNADWNLIAKLKQKIRKPIVGNGDIQCLEDVKEMFLRTGCDRVMIGRALIAKPWLISYQHDSSAHDHEPDLQTQGEHYGNFLKRVLFYSRQAYEEKVGLRKMKFLLVQGRPWVEFGEYLAGQFSRVQSYDEAFEVLEKFFSQTQRMVKRSNLRS